MPQVAAVLKRCEAQSAAGGPRCSELDRYMANCIRVTKRYTDTSRTVASCTRTSASLAAGIGVQYSAGRVTEQGAKLICL
jgi:hypothetical protein